MLQLYLLVLLPVTYALVGGILIGLWGRRKRRQSRPSHREDPSGWLSYWLGPLIAFEVCVWSSVALVCLLLLTLTPLIRTAEAPPALLAFGIVLGGYVVAIVAFDMALVAWTRTQDRWVRRHQAADADGRA